MKPKSEQPFYFQEGNQIVVDDQAPQNSVETIDIIKSGAPKNVPYQSIKPKQIVIENERDKITEV